jgi:hypothetical protein
VTTRALFLAIAIAGCAGNDSPPATSEPIAKVEPTGKEEPPMPPDQPITIASLTDAKAAVGKPVRVEGSAENAKLSAVVSAPDLLVYCLDLSSWPADLAGKRVIATGTLEYTEKFASTVSPDGLHSAGTDGGVYAIRGCKAELAAP